MIDVWVCCEPCREVGIYRDLRVIACPTCGTSKLVSREDQPIIICRLPEVRPNA
jgi:hypothetical protein